MKRVFLRSALLSLLFRSGSFQGQYGVDQRAKRINNINGVTRAKASAKCAGFPFSLQIMYDKTSNHLIVFLMILP